MSKKTKQILFLSLCFFVSFSLVPTVNCAFIPGGGGGGGRTTPQKIAVFFWSSSTSNQEIMNMYKTVLQGEGFEKFFLYEDCTDVEAAFSAIDNYEWSFDKIFFLFDGHGTPGTPDAFHDSVNGYVNYIDLKQYMDNLEASYKGMLIETCFSGGAIPSAFAGSNYLVITSTDQYSQAYNICAFPGMGAFTCEFFRYIDVFDTSAAFTYAKNIVENPPQLIYCPYHQTFKWWNPSAPQHPQIYWGHTYDFFD